MNPLVLGAAEFIGPAPSHALLDREDQVVGTDNDKALHQPGPTVWSL